MHLYPGAVALSVMAGIGACVARVFSVAGPPQSRTFILGPWLPARSPRFDDSLAILRGCVDRILATTCRGVSPRFHKDTVRWPRKIGQVVKVYSTV